MNIPVEIMLRGDPRVYTETIAQAGDPRSWTVADMRHVLEQLLRAVSRAGAPGAADGAVQLRGMNWIVSPYQGAVVIALEIHSASLVAGPFEIAAADLEALVVGALGSVPPGTVVH
jgi:hypothetical protein